MDQLDVVLEDVEFLAELELTTNVIIAATESDAALGESELDALLGLTRRIPTQQTRELS